MLRVLPLASLRSGDRSKSPRFKSLRARFFQAAAARKVHGSSPTAGVFSKRRPLKKSTVQVSPRADFSSGPAATAGCRGRRKSRGTSAVDVSSGPRLPRPRLPRLPRTAAGLPPCFFPAGSGCCRPQRKQKPKGIHVASPAQQNQSRTLEP